MKSNTKIVFLYHSRICLVYGNLLLLLTLLLLFFFSFSFSFSLFLNSTNPNPSRFNAKTQEDEQLRLAIQNLVLNTLRTKKPNDIVLLADDCFQVIDVRYLDKRQRDGRRAGRKKKRDDNNDKKLNYNIGNRELSGDRVVPAGQCIRIQPATDHPPLQQIRCTPTSQGRHGRTRCPLPTHCPRVLARG